MQTYQTKKSLGQHFLRDKNAIQRIVQQLPKDSCVLEIGPGSGAITQPLRQHCQQLTVLEKDDRFANLWQQEAEHDAHFSLVHGDVMDVLETAIKQQPYTWIVGNLPYNISGPLTAKLANIALQGGMVLMYQREVANRLLAEPGERGCGGLSVLVRYFYTVKRLLSLPPGAFSPPPKVHSTVICLQAHHHQHTIAFEPLQKTVRRGFAHRRKTIFNQFRGLLHDEDWQQVGIAKGLRPEALSQHQWIQLAAYLEDKDAP